MIANSARIKTPGKDCVDMRITPIRGEKVYRSSGSTKSVYRMSPQVQNAAIAEWAIAAVKKNQALPG